jgi:hypothetical protein
MSVTIPTARRAIGAPPSAAGTPCPWTVRTVARGLPTLENLLVEPDGSLLLSVPGDGALERLAPDGTRTTVAGDLPGTGGLARRDGWVHVTTGNDPTSLALGTATGTIVRVDPTSGRRETWARGLVAPNGLALLPDGSAVTTRPLSALGVGSAVTRVPADRPAALERYWSDLTGTNGAAVDPSGEWLYVSRMLAPRAEVWRMRTSAPAQRERVADLGEALTEQLDDLTVAGDGRVYQAAFGSGRIHRVDPATGAVCTVASGLAKVVAVEWSPGPGPAGTLHAVTQAGVVYRLDPPV